jgi:hypothetical protein
MFKYLVALLAATLLLPATVSAKDPQFLFSADQEVKSVDIFNKLNTDRDLAKDNWINSPLTKRELITYLIRQEIKEQFNKVWSEHKRFLPEYFEPSGNYSEHGFAVQKNGQGILNRQLVNS